MIPWIKSMAVLAMHVSFYAVMNAQVTVNILDPVLEPGESTQVLIGVDAGTACTVHVYGVNTESLVEFRDTTVRIGADPAIADVHKVIALDVKALPNVSAVWGQYFIVAEILGKSVPPEIITLDPGYSCTGTVEGGHPNPELEISWQAKGTFDVFYVLITENDCGKYSTPTPSTPTAPTTTPSPSTGPVITPTPRFSDDTEPTGPEAPTMPTGPDTGPPSGVPEEVAEELGEYYPEMYNVLYNSGPLEATTNQFSNSPQTYAITVPVAEFVPPGAAYTYFICGTSLVNDVDGGNEIIFGEPRCDRYKPENPITGEPVDDNPCPPPEPICSIKPQPLVEPPMDGGLIQDFRVTNQKIKRDDFLPLGAEGKDYDQLEWECIPSENCPDTKGKKRIPLTGRVKYEWEIIKGEGYFVQLGCLPNLKKDIGEHVIFQPPYVSLPDEKEPSKKQTEIRLKIIDDNPTQPIDKTVERRITITTERRKGSTENYYYMTVDSDNYTLPSIPEVQTENGSCKPVGPKWDNPNDLVKPGEQKPAVLDNEKMVVGQWMRIFAVDQRDNDHVTVRCISDNCSDSVFDKDYEDEVEWKWKIVKPGDGGYFIKGFSRGNLKKQKEITARYVIYEAPLELDEAEKYRDVEFEIEVNNPDGTQVKDKTPEKHKFTLRIYKAGIELARTPEDWLPEKDNSVDLESKLKYHDGNDWQEALAHMCRIHFFELVDITREKGYCNNAPSEDDAETCFDYRMKEEDGDNHEVFNERRKSDKDWPSSSECDARDDYMLEARTKEPEKVYTIKVHSEDYGGFSTLVSHGNINIYNPERQKKEKPVYLSIPVDVNDHPQGRPKKVVYEDNRVTIPRDIDENHIADNGWTAAIGSGAQEDPRDKKVDEDETPEGDKYKSDGYTGYEEYRGFDVVRPQARHVRTDMEKKDLMVWNVAGFDISRFRSQSGFTVHEVGEDNLYYKSYRYWSNFNSPTFPEYQQAGLKLCDGDASGCSGKAGVLGIAKTMTDAPAPPNWVRHVAVYEKRINKKDLIEDGFLTYTDKSQQVVAHELGHAVNTYHHGEAGGTNNNPDYDVKHGPRSGAVECIMRYDNHSVKHCQNLRDSTITVTIRGRERERTAKVEPTGSIFCNTDKGTGYNANDQCFGDCAANRGKCKEQLRVSGRDPDYPKR
jgi:hypothetical protein